MVNFIMYTEDLVSLIENVPAISWSTNPEAVMHDVEKMLVIDRIESCIQVQQDQSADVSVVNGTQYLIDDADESRLR